MKQTWRWYGPEDPVSLADIRQAGATGIVTALHHIPNGEIWPIKEIKQRKALIEACQLEWTVVESVPIHEDIKTHTGEYDRWIENYQQTLRNLATCGVKTICYNFMPVLDWTRTDLEYELPDGSKALRFDQIEFAVFDIHILQRHGAEKAYSDDEIVQAQSRFTSMTEEEKQKLTNTIIAGLPGAEEGYTLEQFRQHLKRYKGIDKAKLREHFAYFLQKIIPVAEEIGIKMAVHPDDPPREILGLPRIISTIEDMRWIAETIDSDANGYTMCTGSYGVRADNDLVKMIKSFASRIYFLHLRSTVREENPFTFHEAAHLAGDVDMYEVIKAVAEEEHRRLAMSENHLIPMRPDHGHQILDDLKKKINPGYSAIGRLKGLAEIRGLELGIHRAMMEKNLVTAITSVPCPHWTTERLTSRIVHLGCGAFHRAHQALYTHHVLEQTDSDWGYCEVNLTLNGVSLIENLKKQSMRYTVSEKGQGKTTLKIIGSMKEGMHPLIDGTQAIIEKMANPDVAIISLTITEKGYCTDATTGRLDPNNEWIIKDIANPAVPRSAIGYITAALKLRFERSLPAVTILSCDNVRENGHVAREAVLGLARLQDKKLAQWIEKQVTFPCTMVDRIVPAATPETLTEIAQQLGVEDPCAIACEPFRQWVIEDNFVNGRPDWDRAGAQFVDDVAPFEMMKLRMLNGAHSFLAYLGYLGGYAYISDTMKNADYRQAVYALMLNEQAPTLSMPEDSDLMAYADKLIERFTNPALKHQTRQIATDGSQKLPQRMIDSIEWHLLRGSDYRCLALGVAGWMRYISGVDEQGQPIDVRDPLKETFAAIFAKYDYSVAVAEDVVKELLAIESIFGKELAKNRDFIDNVTKAYQNLLNVGARQAVAAL
ncbi:D-mannonate oxidoreductase [Xenorhabdus indica]|nr:D-mannonate oxidoreductase [Xenorhabdus indica]